MFIVNNIRDDILCFVKLSNDIIFFENKFYRFKLTNENRFVAVFTMSSSVYGGNFLGKYHILYVI